MVKDMGDIDFIISTLESNKIRELYERQWYPESLYLLAMVDYLSRENDLPICIEYNDIRTKKLKEPIYPSSILTMCAILKSDAPKIESQNEAIPEFMQYNIVEGEVRNVFWYAIYQGNLNTYLKELGKEFRKLNGTKMPRRYRHNLGTSTAKAAK